ncbi:MAG: response regulator transcription factor [Peptococcaceae bacterium]|nr:response regulator transcription factor [Peptococcaceae bacterium]
MTKNRILVVEDDKGISDGIVVNLQYSGYDYVVYADGQKAADSLQVDHAYDLALLDIMLPGKDGFELLPYMKTYNIPVIYLTARTDTPSEIKGLRDGAEDYIVKPFDMLALLVRIEKVLDRNGKLNKILRVADIVVDCENRSVQKSGKIISLKPLEFELFSLLARYKNRTLLRDKMLNEVWGADYYGDTRTVDVHIARLRKKLEISNKLITVPKYGYRLED